MRSSIVKIVFLCVSVIVLNAEPSVYGNSNGSFTSPQKAISQNKKTIMTLKRKVLQQNERIDGLRSIVEGLSKTVHELGQDKQSKKNNYDNVNLLKDLGMMIDKINDEYVSKSELQEALESRLSTKVVLREQPFKDNVKESKDGLEGKSTKNLFGEGVRLFVKKRYDEANKRFTITDIKGYKPAASNYYLGEIAYYTKKYEDAIFYFKKSAGLYDKASYIDTLLLHTAISLEIRGEKKQAIIFYKNIIANYADKKTATIAKDKLKDL